MRRFFANEIFSQNRVRCQTKKTTKQLNKFTENETINTNMQRNEQINTKHVLNFFQIPASCQKYDHAAIAIDSMTNLDRKEVLGRPGQKTDAQENLKSAVIEYFIATSAPTAWNEIKRGGRGGTPG